MTVWFEEYDDAAKETMMFEFFDGWRRKVGCILLVIACMLLVEWIRSRFVEDEFAIPSNAIIGPTMTWIISFDNKPEYWAVSWEEAATSPRPAERRMVFCIPYWAITIPLSLISAYLILWKPRKKVAKPEFARTVFT